MKNKIYILIVISVISWLQYCTRYNTAAARWFTVYQDTRYIPVSGVINYYCTVIAHESGIDDTWIIN